MKGEALELVQIEGSRVVEWVNRNTFKNIRNEETARG